MEFSNLSVTKESVTKVSGTNESVSNLSVSSLPGPTNPQPDVEGEIIFIQVPQLRSVQRFVRKRINQWVSDWEEMHEHSNKIKSFFVVRFEKIGMGHQIFCTIQLIVGNRIWKGTALAGGLHRALIQSMGHLNVRFTGNKSLAPKERPVSELDSDMKIDFDELTESALTRNPMGLRLVR